MIFGSRLSVFANVGVCSPSAPTICVSGKALSNETQYGRLIIAGGEGAGSRAEAPPTPSTTGLDYAAAPVAAALRVAAAGAARGDGHHAIGAGAGDLG
jgi:hypothetical protein